MDFQRTYISHCLLLLSLLLGETCEQQSTQSSELPSMSLAEPKTGQSSTETSTHIAVMSTVSVETSLKLSVTANYFSSTTPALSPLPSTTLHASQTVSSLQISVPAEPSTAALLTDSSVADTRTSTVLRVSREPSTIHQSMTAEFSGSNTLRLSPSSTPLVNTVIPLTISAHSVLQTALPSLKPSTTESATGGGSTSNLLTVIIGGAVGGGVSILLLLTAIIVAVVVMVLYWSRHRLLVPKKGAKLSAKRSQSFILHRMNVRAFAFNPSAQQNEET